uniref:Uncharacterized protein n=1 Tax=Anguilla anguilla TaxID=7936 RepID=A0A0E9U7Z3_ANGAN
MVKFFILTQCRFFYYQTYSISHF